MLLRLKEACWTHLSPSGNCRLPEVRMQMDEMSSERFVHLKSRQSVVQQKLHFRCSFFQNKRDICKISTKYNLQFAAQKLVFLVPQDLQELCLLLFVYVYVYVNVNVMFTFFFLFDHKNIQFPPPCNYNWPLSLEVNWSHPVTCKCKKLFSTRLLQFCSIS